MENKDIEFLSEFRLSKSEFETLDLPTRAILSVTCHASNEVNLFSKIYLFSVPEGNNDEKIDSLAMMQRLLILRTWAAKNFEFYEFISKLKPSGKDKEIISKIAESALRDFEDIQSLDGFNLSRAIRNEVSSHYSYEAAKKNLNHLEDDAVLTLMLHEMEGNSYYPLGEEVMFAGRLNRYTANKSTKDEKLAATSNWLDCNLALTQWLRNTNFEFVTKLLLQKFPSKYARQRMFFLEKGSVAQHKGAAIPLFLRRSEGE